MTCLKKYLGQAVNLSNTKAFPLYLKKAPTKGGFVRVGMKELENHLDSLCSLSQAGNKLFWLLPLVLKEHQFKTDIVKLNIKQVELLCEKYGTTWRGGRRSFYQSIHELEQLNVIKNTGRCTYQVNMQWLGIGSLVQKDF